MPEIDNADTSQSQTGPLGVAWLDYRPSIARAGEDSIVRLVLRNRGRDVALARRRGGSGLVPLARQLRNPYCLGRPAHVSLPHPIAPGEHVEIELAVTVAATTGRIQARVRPRRGVPVLVRGDRLLPALDRRPGRASHRRAPTRRARSTAARARSPQQRSPRCTSPSSSTTQSPSHISWPGQRPGPSGRRSCSTPTPRVGRGRRRHRPGGSRPRARALERRRRPQPRFAHPAAASVPARRPRTVGASRPPRLRRVRRTFRRPRVDHTSAAIRSSTALNTTAPRASATRVSTTR